VHGIEQTAPVPMVGPRIRSSLKEEFLVVGHMLSLTELNDVVEDGNYVVGSIIDGLVEGDDWWLMSKTASARFYRCSNKRYRFDREL